ncbi:MAG: hypothetical protein KKG47_11765 [Proteobacteria bacterium]|nr:hypothetical protein [Pseudomonadota bacterium]MBU1737796.1 hypothetical protein [Pseudomonadota bacterium]
MASREYCSNIAEELEVWSNKLHDLSGKIDRIPSIQKYHLLPQIEDLHIIMTELDDRLCELVTTCPAVEGYSTKERVGRRDLNLNSRESFDYDFGG